MGLSQNTFPQMIFYKIILNLDAYTIYETNEFYVRWLGPFLSYLIVYL
jgi:hypothetical protein